MNTRETSVVLIEPVGESTLAPPPRAVRPRDHVIARAMFGAAMIAVGCFLTLSGLPEIRSAITILAVTAAATRGHWRFLMRVGQAAWLARHGVTTLAELHQVDRRFGRLAQFTIEFHDVDGRLITTTYDWPSSELMRGDRELQDGMAMWFDPDPVLRDGARIVVFHARRRPDCCLLRPHVRWHARFE